MKIGIMTFQKSNNYGAILQSYALQKVIRNYGNNVEIINYDCEYISKPYKLIHLKNKGLGRYVFGVIGSICYLPRRKKCNEFRKYMTYSKRVNKSNIQQLANAYDLFIAGSDQIWNYNLTNYDYNYLLQFVTDGKKKCSYAASLGVKELNDVAAKDYSRLLRDFKKITVREEHGKQLLSSISSEVDTVLDPTLLLTQEEWLKVTKEYKQKKDYILVYQLGISSRMIDFVKALAKQEQCKIIYIPFPINKFLKCQINLTCGPAEWLGMFKNAKYVVTDSFHGTVFSLIFHKNFFVDICEQNSSVGSRIENLLKKFGLSNRLLTKVTETEKHKDIDFGTLDRLLDNERRKSLEILKNMM